MQRAIATLGLLLGAFLLLACGGSSGNEPATEVPPTATATAAPTATLAPEPTATTEPTPTPEPEPPPPTPTPEPEPAEPGADFVQLQEDLQRTVDQYWVAGSYAYAVMDLQTGETAGVRNDVHHMSGCVQNLFVIYQAVLDVDAGRYPLEHVDALIRATTWSSNAQTAWQLYTIVGDGDATEGTRRVASLVHDVLGLHEVVIDHPPGYHANSLGINYNNFVTADAMNTALAALWSGELIDGPLRLYLLEVLADVMPGLQYLTAAVPEGRVSHKNGFFHGDTGYVDNDVGIVQLQRGDQTYAYAVSFFSEEVPEKYGDIVLGQQLGTLAYDVMSARYR